MRSKLNVENIRQLRVGAWEDKKQYLEGDMVTHDITYGTGLETAIFTCTYPHISEAGVREPDGTTTTEWTEKVIIGNVDPGWK